MGGWQLRRPEPPRASTGSSAGRPGSWPPAGRYCSWPSPAALWGQTGGRRWCLQGLSELSPGLQGEDQRWYLNCIQIWVWTCAAASGRSHVSFFFFFKENQTRFWNAQFGVWVLWNYMLLSKLDKPQGAWQWNPPPMRQKGICTLGQQCCVSSSY